MAAIEPVTLGSRPANLLKIRSGCRCVCGRGADANCLGERDQPLPPESLDNKLEHALLPSVIPALDAAFQGGHVHLVDVPIDYSENRRVLMDELRAKVSASQKEAALAWETFMQIKAAVL